MERSPRKSPLVRSCLANTSKHLDQMAPTEKPNVFDELRPKPRTVLNYNLSQTDLQGQRIQEHGVTTFHVQQTWATYELPPPGYVFPVEEVVEPPPPPCETVVKYCSGGKVASYNEEEKWREKMERVQKMYREQLEKLKAANRRYEKEIMDGDHGKLLELVGPPWFQELSPKQLQTVDNLKKCIVRDVKSKTTCHTERNIAELGLVLRPNPRHIKLALKKCCECPVEFLLILYQLMNRQRTKYSLNDRLLLSGVVHLTMRETLKELHIRIPSPPPPLKPPKPRLKREKKKVYKSPYLVPFTFTPEPYKHTGVYKKNHIQYPESPYFSYINELKNEVPEGSIGEEEDKESEEDSVKTKIIITQKQLGITDEQEDELIRELRVAQRTYNALVDYKPVPFLRKPSIYIPCDHGFKNASREKAKKEPAGESETNTTSVKDDEQPPGTSDQCQITYDNTNVSEEDDNTTSEQRKDGDESSSISSDEESVVDNEIKEELAIPSCTGKKCLSKINTKSEETTSASNVQNALQEEALPIAVEDDTHLITIGRRESAECKCKEEVEKIIQNKLCQCDRCKADRLLLEQNVNTEEETTAEESEDVDVEKQEIMEEENGSGTVSDSKPVETCACWETYMARVKLYEEMKKRFDVQQTLMTLQKKYIIGGVTQSPQGEPVYILSGVLPTRECPCAEAYQEQMKEEKRLANMPKIPLNKQKYIISGVHETDEGNVFIVSGAAASEDCKCMKLYKEYEKTHTKCIDAYEQYLRKIAIDKKEYMDELTNDSRFQEPEESLDEDRDECDCKIIENTMEPLNTISEEKIEDIIDAQKDIDEICEMEERNSPMAIQEIVPIKEDDGQIILVQDDELIVDIKNDDKKENEINCPCGPEILSRMCLCDNDFEVIPEPELKRFTLLEKIPCKLLKQVDIIKNALNVLAEDGFPLAKLPDSHKLPHFKLWMQLRCGKFWTQENRFPMLMKSINSWMHLLIYCTRKVRLPKLEISLAESRKYTWAHAKIVKQMAMEKDALYYRKLRQANIEDGREFFPSTFSYELPTSNFRDCFFAYAPSKEEHCICWKPWYLREVKDTSKRKSCL